MRELQNIIGRTYYLCSDSIIQVKDLPLPLSNDNLGINTEFLKLNYKNAKEQILKNFEVEYLTHHLKENNGNISHTAEMCEMDRRTIHRLIKEYNIIYKNENSETSSL